MELTLPSGHKVQIRDQFTRGDRREAQRGLVVVRQPDGTSRMEGSPFTDIAGRILRRMIVSWDFPGIPVPSQAAGDHLQENLLDNLDDDDWETLERAVAPWVNRIIRTQDGGLLTHVPTGIKVQVSSPADAVKLAALDEFEAEDAGPKTTGSQLTATSSPASPALPGPTTTG